MWTDVRTGFTVIDFILEGTSAKLDGKVITADKTEVEDIKRMLKNNRLEEQYIIKPRKNVKAVK